MSAHKPVHDSKHKNKEDEPEPGAREERKLGDFLFNAEGERVGHHRNESECQGKEE